MRIRSVTSILLVLFAGAGSLGCTSETAGPTTTSTGAVYRVDATGSALKITVAAENLDTPLDAAPDPTGATFYFIAGSGSDRGVYSVPAGGGSVTAVHTGAPFVAPEGLVVSTDGKTLFVADREAGPNAGGAVFSLPVAGGAPQALDGTAGLHPTALEVDPEGNLVIAGSGSAGATVVSVAAAGGEPKTLAEGAPLKTPFGVAVAAGGEVYIADQHGGPKSGGQVFRYASGSLEAFGPELAGGDPMGIALTQDGKTVLVSSLNGSTGGSEVTLLDVASGGATVFDDVIKENDTSGGLHRAISTNVFAWVDATPPPDHSGRLR